MFRRSLFRLLAVLVALAIPASAQLSGRSVSEDSGPVSELSTNVRTGSRPVHERGRTVRESSVGFLSDGSTRESSMAPMKSGTFSEISAGTVTSDRSLRREKSRARLAPAPPRLGAERTMPPPVYWEPVYDLDGLVEDLGSIEPLPLSEDDVESFDYEAEDLDSSAFADQEVVPDAAISE
jgi:hypothetical protein